MRDDLRSERRIHQLPFSVHDRLFFPIPLAGKRVMMMMMMVVVVMVDDVDDG